MTAVRILIAEDDAMIAMFLDELLVTMGYAVCAITSTQSRTIAAAVEHSPDLMIIDDGLREGSGVMAVTEILKSGFVPHIFATGNCYQVLKYNPHAIVLQKPYNAQALVRAIERALQPLATPG